MSRCNFSNRSGRCPPGSHGRDRLVEHIGGDGIQHLLLTVEVVVDGSPGQAAGFCDVLQGDMLIAVLQKQPLSGVQNAFSVTSGYLFRGMVCAS